MITLSVKEAANSANARPTACTLCYRHVNQAEHYQMVDMKANGQRWAATIPGEYTRSPFPLQYFFRFSDGDGNCWMHPGLDANLCNQPYYVIRQG